MLGDDLYCRQPVCEVILEEQLNFILVCKPESHKTLYEWVEGLEVTGGVQTVTAKRWTGKTHETDTYRFVNQVPLRDSNSNFGACKRLTLPSLCYKRAANPTTSPPTRL